MTEPKYIITESLRDNLLTTLEMSVPGCDAYKELNELKPVEPMTGNEIESKLMPRHPKTRALTAEEAGYFEGFAKGADAAERHHFGG